MASLYEGGDILSPRYRNHKFYTEKEFPQIVGFCDIVPESLCQKRDKASYEYHLNGNLTYRITRTQHNWEIEEFYEGKLLAISDGPELGGTLSHALINSFEEIPDRTKILIPVSRSEKDMALYCMYHLGGYAMSWLPKTTELGLILDKFVDPELIFLSFSKVPVQYIKWLSEILLKLEITGQSPNRILWCYR